MRLKKAPLGPALLFLLALGAASPVAAEEGIAEKPSNPEDILGNIVVVAGAMKPLPRIAIVPSLSPDLEDVTIRSVARRDLDLCGEFDVLPDSEAPEEAVLSESVDPKVWAGKKVEALVQVNAHKLDGQDKLLLSARVYFANQGPAPVFERRFLVPPAALRIESHRMVDLVIGALTGTKGGFASRMAFVSGTGSQRRVYTMDADGFSPTPVSPPGEIALAPAFGKKDELYWASSANNGEYRIRSEGGGPFDLPIKGSVYGLVFSKDRTQVAVSIAQDQTIKLFLGPDFEHLAPATEVGMALRPTFTPSGKLAFSGEGRFGQRIYVDGKPISPEGLFASAPAFCDHPDGVRAVVAVGVGKDTDLVSTNERGGDMVRLTQNQGRNGYPACSPDGRMLAFFSTRASGQGPGLYIMRLDGGRPKRISTLMGDSLRWEPLPPGPAVEAKN